MIAIATFLGSFGGRLALAGLIIAGLAAVRAGDVRHQRQVAVAAERVRVEEQGKKIDAQAAVVRKKVEAKPAPEISAHLRKYCRDC